VSEDKVKVYVCPVAGREAIIAKLKELIVSAGGMLVCDDKTTLRGFEACVEAADVIAVLICAETSNSSDIKSVIQMGSRLGKRIIGVWLDDAASDVVPPLLDSEGDAVIGMDGETVRKAVILGEPIWTVPSGTKRPEQKTPRHKGH
jgi:hypothetical protein